MIPVELQQYAQWVNWRYEDDGTGKPTKVPYHAPSGSKASVTAPQSWVDYATACSAMSTGFYSGIGFVLTKNDPYTMVDLDDPWALDPPDFEESQRIAARHGKIIEMMDSYTEWSPSGKGMRIIVRGTVPAGARRKKVEVYSDVRYMTITGNTFLDKPIADRSDILGEFHKELAKVPVNIIIKESPQEHADAVIWDRMMNAANGELALAIWNGESHGKTGDGSHSAGDQALVNLLQFYTHNSEQITRMFLRSPRAYRLVSGEKHKWPKYIPNMIQKSFDRELPDIDFSQLRMTVAGGNKSEAVIALPPAPIVNQVVFPPGLMGEIASFIYAQAAMPVPEIALVGAMALMAGICGRAYNVSDEGLNMYILLLALTGVGKEGAKKGIGKLMTEVEKLAPAVSTFRGPAEIASGPALTKYLAKDSPCCFSIMGEFGLRLHQMCNDQAQSHMIGLRRVLLDLFHQSGKGGSLQAHIYSDKEKNTDVLHSPAFTIFGESTPETFYRHLDESMLSDGLLPRFTIVEYSGDRVDLSEHFTDVEPPKELINRLAELATFCIQMHHANRVLSCAFTPEAKEYSRELSKDYTRKINANREDGVARQLYNRAHLKILKLAALVAVGINPIAPTITWENMEWGRKLVDADNQNILYKFQMGKVGRESGDLNQTHEMIECIKDYMRRPWDKHLQKFNVPLAMKQANIIPYQYIQRQCASRAAFRQDRVGATFAINRALQTLTYEGGLREVKPNQLSQEFNTSMKAYAVVDQSMLS
jgi:hypothetical protein